MWCTLVGAAHHAGGEHADVGAVHWVHSSRRTGYALELVRSNQSRLPEIQQRRHDEDEQVAREEAHGGGAIDVGDPSSPEKHEPTFSTSVLDVEST
jgi:hypothetical protein